MSKTRVFVSLQILLVLGSGVLVSHAHARGHSHHQKSAPYGKVNAELAAEIAYDSKAEPVAMETAAQDMMYRKGWEVIEKYFPSLGYPSQNPAPVNQRDPTDLRFYAQSVTEDPGRSPVPLISIICSLDSSQLTGPLKRLRDELASADNPADFSHWDLQELRNATDLLTIPQTAAKRVAYRAPKPTLSYSQSAQLYAMILALLRKDIKWAEKQQSVSTQGPSGIDLPDMQDFSEPAKPPVRAIHRPRGARCLSAISPAVLWLNPCKRDSSKSALTAFRSIATETHLS